MRCGTPVVSSDFPAVVEAVGDAAAIGGLRGEGLVHMHRIVVVRGVGELLDALFRDGDDLLRRHADVEFLEDVAAGGVFRDNFGHGPALARFDGSHHVRSSAA